jgi:hypothetical protein
MAMLVPDARAVSKEIGPRQSCYLWTTHTRARDANPSTGQDTQSASRVRHTQLVKGEGVGWKRKQWN